MPPNPFRRQPNINDMMYPKGSKQPRQVWAAVMNVYKEPPSNVTPTPTPTISATPTVTPTISVTPTITNTPTISLSPTNTPTISVSPTVTPTISLTPTNTTSPTPTPSTTPSSITYITSTSSTADASTYTFNNVNIGGPGLIVVTYSLTTNSAQSFSSASIGGVSAPLVAGTNVGDRTNTGIISARITGGTTANITLTFGGAGTNLTIGVYRIQNNTSDTVSRTKTNNASSGLSIGVNLDNALINTLAVAVVTSFTSIGPFSWSNATENYDGNIESGSATGASTKRGSAGTFGMTATSTGTISNATMVGAGWV